ncbi:hypothetical protein [Saccharopolyspora hattusasensis]|uniref:hypothetical protein n=1 Tax=Saccharopolyspora hattusasensis TaxID=1128679 RepID=UPI003D961EAF
MALQSRQALFVLRWHSDNPEWGHLGRVTGRSTPAAFLGFVPLDRVLTDTARRRAIPVGGGFTELWFTGNRPDQASNRRDTGGRG